MQTQYFFNDRTELCIFDIYDALIFNFPDSIVQLVDIYSFEAYPDNIPVIFSDEIQKRIVFFKLPFDPSGEYFIDYSFAYLINRVLLVSMHSENYQIIIQIFFFF
jgi:hypothetical protein